MLSRTARSVGVSLTHSEGVFRKVDEVLSAPRTCVVRLISNCRQLSEVQSGWIGVTNRVGSATAVVHGDRQSVWNEVGVNRIVVGRSLPRAGSHDVQASYGWLRSGSCVRGACKVAASPVGVDGAESGPGLEGVALPGGGPRLCRR